MARSTVTHPEASGVRVVAPWVHVPVVHTKPPHENGPMSGSRSMTVEPHGIARDRHRRRPRRPQPERSSPAPPSMVYSTGNVVPPGSVTTGDRALVTTIAVRLFVAVIFVSLPAAAGVTTIRPVSSVPVNGAKAMAALGAPGSVKVST